MTAKKLKSSVTGAILHTREETTFQTNIFAISKREKL